MSAERIFTEQMNECIAIQTSGNNCYSLMSLKSMVSKIMIQFNKSGNQSSIKKGRPKKMLPELGFK